MRCDHVSDARRDAYIARLIRHRVPGATYDDLAALGTQSDALPSEIAEAIIDAIEALEERVEELATRSSTER
jgi:uncharacterized FAD-dependent dehydrogenase